MRISVCSTSFRKKSGIRRKNESSSRSALSRRCRAGRRRMHGSRSTPLADDRKESDFVAEYLLHLEKERDMSAHTLKAYRRDLDELLEYLGTYYGEREWTWQGIDRLALRGFLAHLNRRELSKRSISRALSAVRSFYSWLNRNEIVDANPARGVSSPKLEKYLPGYLDRAQIDLLFQSAALHAQNG